MAKDDTRPGTRPRRALQHEERRRSRRALGILGLLLAVLFAGFLGTVGWVVFNAQKALDVSTGGKGGNVIEVLLPAQPPATAVAAGRLNILVAGSSFDDPGHPGGTLTDGIMVASIDLASKKTTLASIPRDLWVQYGGKSMKINAVYPAAGGGLDGLTALGGVAETVTGLHIDQHVLIGYKALRGVIDEIGGIDVTIASPDPRGINDPNVGLRLENGLQHLDGETARKLAQARNDPVPAGGEYGLPQGDYSRQQSQRLIIGGILTKIKSTPTLANPLTVVNLFTQLSQNIVTDVTAGQLRSLYDLTSKSGNPGGFTIKGDATHNLLTDYNTPPAGDALVPRAGIYDYSAIQQYVASSLG